jgi:hypothetical protein
MASIKRDSTLACLATGENFQYDFKGARSAPRAWRRVTAHAVSGESWRTQQKAGAKRPREPSHHAAAARLSAAAHGGGRPGTDLGIAPQQPGAARR